MDCATLSNDGQYTIFKYKDVTIKFKTAYSLEYYAEVKQWDEGYLVVMAKYQHNAELEEEYIDLLPILEDLYIDANEFLNPIRNVVIE